MPSTLWLHSNDHYRASFPVICYSTASSPIKHFQLSSPLCLTTMVENPHSPHIKHLITIGYWTTVLYCIQRWFYHTWKWLRKGTTHAAMTKISPVFNHSCYVHHHHHILSYDTHHTLVIHHYKLSFLPSGAKNWQETSAESPHCHPHKYQCMCSSCSGMLTSLKPLYCQSSLE